VIEKSQKAIGLDGLAGSNLNASNGVDKDASSTSNATVNVNFLQGALPIITGSSSGSEIPMVPVALASVPTSVLQWILEIACTCEGPKCDCPPALTMLKALVDFQNTLDSHPKGGEAAAPDSVTTQEDEIKPARDEETSSEFNEPDWIAWRDFYGETPITISHSDVAAAEKVLKYDRVNLCSCFGPPPCCPPVFELCPALGKQLESRPCKDCHGTVIFGEHCCPPLW
jgi:hypothetical protein